MNETGKRYYNLWSGKLSDYCGCGFTSDGSLLEFVSGGLQKWIDIVSDTAVYVRTLEGATDAGKICHNVYLFRNYDEDLINRKCKMDLVVYSPYIKASYVVSGVHSLHFETLENNNSYTKYKMIFTKNGNDYSVTRCGGYLYTDELLKIAEEIDYNSTF